MLEEYEAPRSPAHLYFDCRHPFLDAEISPEEVKKAINKSKNNKAPGIDDISNEFWKNLPDTWIQHVTDLFNRMYDEGRVPEDWSKSKMIMLYKKGDPNLPENYRGIALLNAITKIFTSILSSRIKTFIETNGIQMEGQNGFRSRRSTEDNIFILNTKITAALAKEGGKLFMAFIDFRRAFDTVDHRILWQKLYNCGLSSKLIRKITVLL